MSARLPGDGDTIAALATPPGRGGIGIIRLSGPRSRTIAAQLGRCDFSPRTARFCHLRDSAGDPLDDAVVLYYPQPASFTGEDVVELQCHGSPVQLQAILYACQRLGARPAQPGEFSQRAFLNGKLDLVQAEAIADLIGSGSEAAARGALRSLSGEFSRRVRVLLDELIKLRVFVEAAIDFPEEEVDFITDSDILQRLETLHEQLQTTLVTARRGRALRDGMKLVIAGAPNAGKSSLLNQLSEHDTAIVTAVAGTTRDVLREHIHIDGLPLHIVDTAGLRRGADDVEREGIRRARVEMGSADRILLIVDSSDAPQAISAAALIKRFTADLPAGVPITLVRNKCDVSGNTPAVGDESGTATITLSAKTGAGMDLLRQHLLDLAGFSDAAGTDFTARHRHIAALEETAGHVATAGLQLREHQSAELVAEDLRYAQDSLGAITGQYTSDDLLGAIFSSFCIGK